MRTYILILFVPENEELTIEPLGEVDVLAGFYAYVGSVPDAELAGRLKQHLSPITRPNTPIDYIQSISLVEEIWLSSSTEDYVHDWADLLVDVPGSIALIEEFEVDDCECDTHLYYFDIRPMLQDFVVGVRQQFPDDIVVRAFAREEDEDEA